MLWIRSKAIPKYRVNNFSDSPPTLLINVIHWPIHCIPGREKSSSLLLLKVALTGQYPVITNPANHNRLLFEDFKQIGGYYHLLGSVSAYSPFHVADTLTVSLKIRFDRQNVKFKSIPHFPALAAKEELQQLRNIHLVSLKTDRSAPHDSYVANLSSPLWQAASPTAECRTWFWEPFAQMLISTTLVCKLRLKRLVRLALTWWTWKVWWIYGRIMWSPAPIYELIICTKPPSKCRRLPFNQGLH